MSAFYFDGKNIIYQDLINKLPEGKVYYKGVNIIPYIDKSVFVEFYPNNATGDIIDIFIDNKLYDRRKVLPDKSLYCKMKTPYGRFKIRTEFNGKIITEDNYMAVNIFVFFLILAKEFNYDYIEIFKMFSNLYFATLQNDFIYKKYGWFFDLVQGTFNSSIYRRIVVGDDLPSGYLGTIRSFMNAATYYGLKELIRSFTTQYATIIPYREFNGWILRSASIFPINSLNSVWIQRFNNYLLIDSPNDLPPLPTNVKRIILMDKNFKLYTLLIIINYWPTSFTEVDKEILNNLIYKILPANIKVEIKYP